MSSPEVEQAVAPPTVVSADNDPAVKNEQLVSDAPKLTAAPPLAVPPNRAATIFRHLLARRGFLVMVPVLILAWLAQQKATPGFNLWLPYKPNTDPTAGPQDILASTYLYIAAISLMIVGFLFTYKTKYFIRRGNYEPNAATDAKAVAARPRRLRVSEAAQHRPPAPPRPSRKGIVGALRSSWWRLLLGAGALVVNFFAVQRAAATPYELLPVILWLGSIALLVLACIRQRTGLWPLEKDNPQDYPHELDEDGRRDSSWAFNSKWLEIAIVVIVMIFVAVVRLWNLEGMPIGIHGDETEIALRGLKVMQGNTQGVPFLGPSDWYFFPSMVMWGQILGMSVLGTDTFAGARLFGAVCGIGTVLFFYLGLRQMFKGRTALIGAILLGTAEVPNLYGRFSPAGEPLDVCWAACFYFVFKALRSKRHLDFVWAGVAAGISQYAYPTSRLIIPYLGVLVLFLIITRWRYIRDYWAHTVTAVVAFAVVASPMLAATLRDPEVLNSRLRDVNILANGAGHIFGRWAVPLSAPVPPQPGGNVFTVGAVRHVAEHWNEGWKDVIWNQIVAAYTALHATADKYYFYISGIPFFTPTVAMFGMLGLGYFLWRWRDPRYMFFSLLFWVSTLIGIALTIDDPDYMRWNGTGPFFYIFPAVMLNKFIFEMERTGWFALPDIGALLRRRFATRPALQPTATASYNLAAAGLGSNVMLSETLRPSVSVPAGTVTHQPVAEAVPTTRRQTLTRTRQYIPNLLLFGLLALLGFQQIYNFFVTYNETKPFTINYAQAEYARSLDQDKVGGPYYVYHTGMPGFFFNYSNVKYRAPGLQGEDAYNQVTAVPVTRPSEQGVAFMLFNGYQQYAPVVSQFYPEVPVEEVAYLGSGTSLYGIRLTRQVISATQTLTLTYHAGDNLDSPGAVQQMLKTTSTDQRPGTHAAGLQYPAVAQWQGSIYIPTYGQYILNLTNQTAEGKATPMRLNLDGQKWLEVTSEPLTSTQLVLAQGWHNLDLRARLDNDRQRVNFNLTGSGLSGTPPRQYLFSGATSERQHGLYAEIRSGSDLNAPVIKRRVDHTLGFMNIQRSLNLEGLFFVTWQGKVIIPTAGAYSFNLEAAGSVRLYIGGRNGENLVNPGQAVQLAAGEQPIYIEFSGQPQGGDSQPLRLSWTKPDGSNETVLSANLLPERNIFRPDEVGDLSQAQVQAAPAPGKLAPIASLPTEGDSTTFTKPTAVQLDSEGNYYVADAGDFKIYVFDRDRKPIRNWPVFEAASGADRGRFSEITIYQDRLLAVNSDGRLAVYSLTGKLLQEMNKDKSFGTYGLNGSCVSGNGTFYVADTGQNRVLKLGADGKIAQVLGGSNAPQDRKFDQPVDCAVGDDGSVYATDMAKRLIRFDAQGQWAQFWPLPQLDTGDGCLYLARDGDRFYITNANKATIFAFEPTSNSLTGFGEGGKGVGQFDFISNVATDNAGRVYVSEFNGRRVQVFDRP